MKRHEQDFLRAALVGACVAATACLASPRPIRAASILYESGTLGPTAVSWQDVLNQNALAENIKLNAFNGVRFQVTNTVLTDRVGGHLVGAPTFPNNTLFAAIIRLENQNDVPDSADLSTSDVLGTALLSVPSVSSEVFGDMHLPLAPGWYALLFGSGLFGATGQGGALLNNSDIDMPSYLGFLSGFGWGNRLPGKRFVVEGIVIPEPSAVLLASVFVVRLLRRKRG